MADMKRIQAFKFRFVPTLEQERLLSRHAGCVRFVWNTSLDLQTKRLDAGMPLLSYGDLAKLLTLWRSSEEYGFLSLGPVHPQQQALKNLDRALWEALDRRNPKRFPRFKRKGEGDSLRYPDPLQVKLDLSTRDKDGRIVLPRIFLPKVGWVKVRLSRPIAGEIKNATVTRKAGRWAVSIQTETEVPEPEMRTSPEIGLDLGVVSFATLSDGTRLHPDERLVRAMKRAEGRLRWEQRKLSRKYREGAEKPELRHAETPHGESPRKTLRHAPGFSPQDLEGDERNPSRRLCRGPEDPEHDAKRPGHPGEPRTERPAEVRAEPLHSVPGMGNVPLLAGV